MPTSTEIDDQINRYAERQGTGLPLPADIPSSKSPIVTGNTGFDVALSNKQWPKGSFKGESASVIQGPLEGFLEGLKGTINFITSKDEPTFKARREASRQGLDSSAETVSQPKAAIPVPTEPPGVIDKPSRVVSPSVASEGSSITQPVNYGTKIPGIVRRGNSFSQTGVEPTSHQTSPAPGDLLKGAVRPSTGVDAYGNSTAITQQLKGELDGVLAEKAAAQADFDARYANRPTYAQQQQQDADRFTRFVNESDTARLAHDLGTGGGNAQTNAGKIAALNAMQQRDVAARADATARAGQLLTADAARGQQAVLSKGQLLQHNTAMAQILGSPLHQQGQLIDMALKSGQLSQAQAIQDLQAQLLAAGKAGDANKQAQLALLLRQLSGKDAQEGKLISVGGGQEIDSDTGMLRTLPSQAVYAVPGQEPRIISARTKGKPTFSQADLEFTAKKHGLTVEQVKARLQEKE